MKRALFLDRDGVINIDHGYVSKIEDFKFIEDIFEIIELFRSQNYYIFIVTNQSGIGRDYYTIEDFLTLTEHMQSEFKKRGIRVDKVYYCPHAPEERCSCRKPSTGMVKQAMQEFNIDLKNSWLVGDKQSDIDLAKNAKIGTSVAITNKELSDANYTFATIKEFKEFLEQNIDKIS